MIGTRPEGAIDGVVITAVPYIGLVVSVHGRPGRLAIIDESGAVIAAGAQVAEEAEAVSVNSFRAFLKGQGWLKIIGKPIAN